jgi:hypothetical protein
MGGEELYLLSLHAPPWRIAGSLYLRKIALTNSNTKVMLIAATGREGKRAKRTFVQHRNASQSFDEAPQIQCLWKHNGIVSLHRTKNGSCDRHVVMLHFTALVMLQPPVVWLLYLI